MQGKTIVVTGAASGIGRAVALAAAQRGAKVAALDINIAGVRAVEREMRDRGSPAAIGVGCDVRDEGQVTAAFQRTVDDLGTPDGLFANAGVEINVQVHEMPLAEWHRTLDVNLTGTFLCCKHAIRLMLSAGGGSIVCTSSPSAFVGFAGGGNGAYAASKGGISAFVRSLALDYAAHGIRVNAVVPGTTDTPMMLAGAAPDQKERLRSDIIETVRHQVPLQRLGSPDEVAEAVLWLLGPCSSYVTGSHLVCDGGLLAKSANTV